MPVAIPFIAAAAGAAASAVIGGGVLGAVAAAGAALVVSAVGAAVFRPKSPSAARSANVTPGTDTGPGSGFDPRSLGSFEVWSQTLGGILQVAGVAGFLENLDEVIAASDSEGGAWRAFIQIWWDRFGSAEVSVSDLLGLAQSAEASLPISAKNEHGLKVSLGAAFTKLRDRAFRISDRLVHLRQGKALHKSQRWRLEPAAETLVRGGLVGLGGVSRGETPIGLGQELRGFDGSCGSLGSFSHPYACARAHVRE
jgi:hypothetical protein